MSGSMLTNKVSEAELEVYKDQDQSNVRIKVDPGRVSETYLGGGKDPDERESQDKCLYMKGP
jgi:hypothetical protein